jgi:hypothetical protein
MIGSRGFIFICSLHIGFELPLVKWIMSCVTTVSFVVLINRVGTSFFKSGRGLRQGVLLLPYLFLLVADGLSRAFVEAKRVNTFHGIKMGRHENLTHLLFVDDVLIFCYCAEPEGKMLKDILNLFCAATRMLINVGKSVIFLPNDNEDIQKYFQVCSISHCKALGEGDQIFGFYAKAQ